MWRDIYRIPLGCGALDKLLDGGFPSSNVTLIYGERSSGKTQICHQLIAHLLATKPNAHAVYVDVDLAFSPERVMKIARRFGAIGSRDVLSRVLYYKPSTFDEQYELINLLDENYDKIPHQLIVVDSLSTLIRGEYGIAVIERQRCLSNYVRKLQEYAIKRNVVIVVTDNVHVVKYVNREMLLPVSSQALEISMTRLRLIRGFGARRIARIESSPLLPEGEAAFIISDEGLIDL